MERLCFHRVYGNDETACRLSVSLSLCFPTNPVYTYLPLFEKHQSAIKAFWKGKEKQKQELTPGKAFRLKSRVCGLVPI